MAKKECSEGVAALAFLAMLDDHGCRLVRRRQQFFLFDGVCYSEISDEMVQAAVYRFLLTFVGERMWPKFVESVVAMIAWEPGVQIPDDTPLPSMLDGDDRPYVAVRNGLIDLEALFGGAESVDEILRPHTPNWFSVAAMGMDFDPPADCPRFRSTIAEILQGDHERIARLQEWVGYLLWQGNEYKKVLLLHGEGDTGKSTILNAIVDVIGEKNICSMSFEDISNRFALAATEGKLASVSFEIGELSKTAEAKLKTLSGNDAAVQFERKGQDAVIGHPTCKLMFATNNLPRIIDSSGATHDRLLLIPCLRRFRGREVDRNLREKLQCELPGILNWALVGRYRLYQQGCFTHSAICDQALAEYREETNPTERFLRSFVVAAEGEAIYAADLFQRYRQWMLDNSFSTKNEANFGVAVRKVFPHVRREREGSGMRPYYYAGITFGAAGDGLPTSERQVVPEVTPPTGLLGELWERFLWRPLLLPGPPETSPAEPRTASKIGKITGSDKLDKIFPTRDQEFLTRFRLLEDMQNEVAGLKRKLHDLQWQSRQAKPPEKKPLSVIYSDPVHPPVAADVSRGFQKIMKALGDPDVLHDHGPQEPQS